MYLLWLLLLSCLCANYTIVMLQISAAEVSQSVLLRLPSHVLRIILSHVVPPLPHRVRLMFVCRKFYHLLCEPASWTDVRTFQLSDGHGGLFGHLTFRLNDTNIGSIQACIKRRCVLPCNEHRRTTAQQYETLAHMLTLFHNSPFIHNITHVKIKLHFGNCLHMHWPVYKALQTFLRIVQQRLRKVHKVSLNIRLWRDSDSDNRALVSEWLQLVFVELFTAPTRHITQLNIEDLRPYDTAAENNVFAEQLLQLLIDNCTTLRSFAGATCRGMLANLTLLEQVIVIIVTSLNYYVHLFI